MKRAILASIIISLFVIGALNAQTHVGGDITTNTFWDLGGSPYIVDSPIRIINSAVLTIDPGVTVMFDSATGMQVGREESWGCSGRHGQLVAEGEPGYPITFTSLSDSGGDWWGLLFEDCSDAGSRSSITHCIIEMTGVSNRYDINATLHFRAANDHSISHTYINNTTGYALYLWASSVTIAHSTITSSTAGRAIFLDNGSSPTFSNDSIIGDGCFYWLYSQTNNCNPIIDNCIFSGSVNRAVRLGTSFQLTNSEFSGATNPGIEVLGGDLGGNRTWRKLPGATNYIIKNSNFRVKDGYTLTLEAGLTLEFDAGIELQIGIENSWGCSGRNGALWAIGTSIEPITFTSSSGASGGWKGIIFDDCSDYGMSSALVHCIIENAGLSNSYGGLTNVYCRSTTTPRIDSTIVRNSSNTGLHLSNSSLSDTLRNNSIVNNTNIGIYLTGSSNAKIGASPENRNVISDNGDADGFYNIKNETSNNIPASYNYWGTMDSLDIEASIYDSVDNPSYGRVQFMPFEIMYPLIGIAPSVHNFDSLEIGDTTSLSVWIKNTGAGTLEIDTCFTTSSVFPIIASSLTPMAPGDSSFLGIVFVPEEEGAYDETLWVYSEFDTGFVRLIGYGFPEVHPSLQRIAILINSTHEDRHYKSIELAYKSCLRRGFDKENIYVLHHMDDLDIDGDGINDVNGLATKANVQYAFETWAADLAGESTKLYVYFTDHGGVNKYCLVDFNPSDPITYLTPTELNTIYENYSSASSADTIFTIMSTCKSGSFIDELSSPSRIIMTATNASLNSYYYYGTPIYFGYLVWVKLINGYDFAETFNWTAEMIHEFARPRDRQIPLLDDNADGTGHRGPLPNGGDGFFAADVFWGVGEGSRSPMDTPEILAFTTDTSTYPGTIRFQVETSMDVDTCWVYFVRTDTVYEVPEYEEVVVYPEYIYLPETSPMVYEWAVLRDSLPHGNYEFVAIVQAPPGTSGIGDVSSPANADVEYHGMLYDSKTPDRYALTVEPNPFNSACRISAPEGAKVEIFDIEGRKISELPGGVQVWKPEASVGSGIYLVRATVGPSTGSVNETITKRVVYLK